MIKRILVALSGSPYSAVAVQHALELARQHEAEVTGVTLVNIEALADVGPIPLGGASAATELVTFRQIVTEERIDQTITDFEAACSDTEVKHQVIREVGDPFDAFLSMWRYHDIALIGLRGLFEYGIVHNPDDHIIRLIREGMRPIIAVSPDKHAIHRIMIAYDGSIQAAHAMKELVQSRIWPAAKLAIVCMDVKPQQADVLLSDAGDYCRAHGYDVELEFVDAHPREALLAHAEGWDADMLVLGSTARSKLSRYVLGDTALTMIRNSDIPLFLSR